MRFASKDEINEVPNQFSSQSQEKQTSLTPSPVVQTNEIQKVSQSSLPSTIPTTGSSLDISPPLSSLHKSSHLSFIMKTIRTPVKSFILKTIPASGKFLKKGENLTIEFKSGVQILQIETLIQVTNEDGEDIGGYASVGENQRQVIFVPDIPFRSGSTYSIQICSSSVGVESKESLRDSWWQFVVE